MTEQEIIQLYKDYIDNNTSDQSSNYTDDNLTTTLQLQSYAIASTTDFTSVLNIGNVILDTFFNGSYHRLNRLDIINEFRSFIGSGNEYYTDYELDLVLEASSYDLYNDINYGDLYNNSGSFDKINLFNYGKNLLLLEQNQDQIILLLAKVYTDYYSDDEELVLLLREASIVLNNNPDYSLLRDIHRVMFLLALVKTAIDNSQRILTKNILYDYRIRLNDVSGSQYTDDDLLRRLIDGSNLLYNNKYFSAIIDSIEKEDNLFDKCDSISQTYYLINYIISDFREYINDKNPEVDKRVFTDSELTHILTEASIIVFDNDDIEETINQSLQQTKTLYQLMAYGKVLVWSKFRADSSLFYKYTEGSTHEQIDKSKVYDQINKEYNALLNWYIENYGQPDLKAKYTVLSGATFNLITGETRTI